MQLSEKRATRKRAATPLEEYRQFKTLISDLAFSPPTAIALLALPGAYDRLVRRHHVGRLTMGAR